MPKLKRDGTTSTVLCRHFRQKRMYIQGAGPNPQAFEPASFAHCWCLRTLRQYGPDDASVEPEGCRPGRGCFEER